MKNVRRAIEIADGYKVLFNDTMAAGEYEEARAVLNDLKLFLADCEFQMTLGRKAAETLAGIYSSCFNAYRNRK